MSAEVPEGQWRRAPRNIPLCPALRSWLMPPVPKVRPAAAMRSGRREGSPASGTPAPASWPSGTAPSPGTLLGKRVGRRSPGPVAGSPRGRVVRSKLGWESTAPVRCALKTPRALGPARGRRGHRSGRVCAQAGRSRSSPAHRQTQARSTQQPSQGSRAGSASLSLPGHAQGREPPPGMIGSLRGWRPALL